MLRRQKEKSADFEELHDKLFKTMETFTTNLEDRYEDKMAIRNRQLERLLEWARKVSKKTGVPLENL